MSDKEWWGADVVPRIRWMIVVDALTLRQKEIPEGGYLPEGYGIAWRCIDRNAAVCMPMPLNIIVGRLRWFWIELRHGFGMPLDRYAQSAEKARWEGYGKGYDHGYESGLRHAQIAAQASMTPRQATTP